MRLIVGSITAVARSLRGRWCVALRTWRRWPARFWARSRARTLRHLTDCWSSPPTAALATFRELRASFLAETVALLREYVWCVIADAPAVGTGSDTTVLRASTGASSWHE